jgi:hypothetical protein
MINTIDRARTNSVTAHTDQASQETERNLITSPFDQVAAKYGDPYGDDTHQREDKEGYPSQKVA